MGATRRAAGLAALLASCLAAACASSGAVPAPFPRPSAPVPAPAAPAPDTAPLPLPELVRTAMSLRGTPYRDGGSDPSGFDCSGFVEYVFAKHGLAIPRTVTAQYRLGRSVGADALEAGDLVFFSTVAPGPSHVGIVVSTGEFVHAPSTSGVVRVERLDAGYWAGRYVGARRLP